MSNEKHLLAPFTYLSSNPGKSIRSKLIQAFDIWIKVPQPELDIISSITEMLHTSSLLIDDVQDASELRRGIPVAHKIFGVPQTINCANYVYFQALEKVLALDNPDATKAFTEEMLQLHRGQGMELYWRDNSQCPTETEYIQMVGNKTGGLLRLAVKLMMALSSNIDTCRDYVALVDLLGVHFQIRDDYCNLASTKYTDNKGFAEDLTEGKFSFPVIHCIKTDLENKGTLLGQIIAQRTTDVNLKKYAITLMSSSQSFEYTMQKIKHLEAQVCTEIEKLGGNKVLTDIVNYLAQSI